MRPGWVNIDQHSDKADVIGDFTLMEYANVDEIMLSHVLEHFSWQISSSVVAFLYGWLKTNGRLTIEVPDITELLKFDPDHPLFNLAIYGVQIHDGEYHKAAFTLESLLRIVTEAGFLVESARTFLSEHPNRTDYPCIEVVAIK